MANAAEMIWIDPPRGMAKALEQYGEKVLVAVQAVAEFIALKMQNAARTNAIWEDRTGNARTGIFGVSTREAAEEVVAIYLSHGHTVYYGIFLELAHGGKYAVIMPTIEKHLPELKRLLDNLFQ